MTNNKKMFSLIFIIFIVLTAITILLIISTLDNNRITPYAEGTEVGYIYIGGKTYSQAVHALETDINNWKNADDLTIELTYQDSAFTVDLNPDVFQFDASGSINSIVEKQKMDYSTGRNVVKVSLAAGQENYFNQLISSHFLDLKFHDFDINLIESQVLEEVSFLYKNIYVDLGSAVNVSTAKTTPIGNPTMLIFAQADFLKSRIDNFIGNSFEIKAKSQFSLNDLIIGLYNQELKDNGGFTETKLDDIDNIYNYYFSQAELNVIATGIYQTILDTNFTNISKNISEKLPQFVINSPGLEANSQIGYEFTTEEKMDANNTRYTAITNVTFDNIKDLSFYNPNDYSYYIKVKSAIDGSNNNVLSFQLYGTPFINQYSHKILNENIITSSGAVGEHAIVTRTTKITFPKGELTSVDTILSEDIYMPIEDVPNP